VAPNSPDLNPLDYHIWGLRVSWLLLASESTLNHSISHHIIIFIHQVVVNIQ